MTITARYPGQCSACGGSIEPGESIEWEKGRKARHVTCPAAGTLLNAAYQPKGETARTNRKPAACTFCGVAIPVGGGNLWWGEDGCCSDPRHFDDGGWHVTCFDRDACEARVQAQRKAAKREAAEAKTKADAERLERQERAARLKAERETLTAGLERTTAPVPMDATRGQVIHSDDAGAYHVAITEATTADGQRILIEDATGYDDWRTYVWATPDHARALRLAAAVEAGITREKAEAWLAQYAGCMGEDIYRAALEG